MLEFHKLYIVYISCEHNITHFGLFMYYCNMYSFETKLRVRYGETDQMGFAYYGVYAQYYEVGRVELLRSIGISYKNIEAMGFALPVVNLNINYKKPALYDDEITIVTTIRKMPSAKIFFHYETYNDDNDLPFKLPPLLSPLRNNERP